MNKEECFNLGYIARRVGNHGELGFVLDVDDPQRYKKLESVFVELNNSLVPFFIKSIRISGKNATVKIEGIDSIDRAEELIRSGLFLPLSALPKLKSKQFYFHEMPGFTVSDQQYGDIGTVVEVLDFPQQAIFKIRHGQNEILIPARPDFIISIDKETRHLSLDAPPGLIDIYLTHAEDNESEKETDEGADPADE